MFQTLFFITNIIIHILFQYDYGSIGKENLSRPISKERTYQSSVHVPTSTYTRITGPPLIHQDEETDDHGLMDTTLDTTASSDRRGIKRKTVRFVSWKLKCSAEISDVKIKIFLVIVLIIFHLVENEMVIPYMKSQ